MPLPLFGGEKRLEQVGKGFPVHAAAVVADGQQNKGAGHSAGMFGTVIGVKNHIVRFNSDLAGIADGVPGIDTKVDENLVELRGVDLHLTEILAR